MLFRAYSIKKVFDYFDPEQRLWEQKLFDKFYIHRDRFPWEEDYGTTYLGDDESPVYEMSRILKGSKLYPKLLLTGPQGCGKATELAKLRKLVENKFHIFLFSAKSMTMDYKLKPEFVPGKIILEMEDKIKQKDKSFYSKNVEPLTKRIRGWETREAEVDTENKKLADSFVDRFTKFEEPVTGKLTSISKLSAKPTAFETISTVNKTAKKLEQNKWWQFWKRKKRVLVLIADMEKLDPESAKNIFITSYLSLQKIECAAVFTIPITLTHGKNYELLSRNFLKIYYLNNFTIRDRGGNDIPTTIYLLKELIYRRVYRRLIDEAVAEKIIKYSGGVLFELIRIMRECCIVAMNLGVRFYIDDEILENAIKRIRSNYRLTKSEIDSLKYIRAYQNHPDEEIINNLIENNYISRYTWENQSWYAVYPVLEELLDEQDNWAEK